MTIFSTRSTSPPKSAWPGVSTMLILTPLYVAGAVLGQNGDAALTLDVAGVHDALGHHLVVAESTGLLEHLVDQSGLAVVDVRDDRDVAEIFLNHIRSLSN